MTDKTSRVELDELIQRLRTESLYADKATLEIMDLCMAAADALESLQDQYDQLLIRIAESERQRAAAEADMKLMADAVREKHCDETVCFACKFDCDMSINDSGVYSNECPGFDKDDCFEWRGPQEAGEGGR